MKKCMIVFLCLMLAAGMAGSAWASMTGDQVFGVPYGTAGYGYGSTAGVPNYGSAGGVPNYAAAGVPNYGAAAGVPRTSAEGVVPNLAAAASGYPTYGAMAGYPAYGSGSLDGYTVTSGSGYTPSTAPSASYTPPATKYRITYMPGSYASGAPLVVEWNPGYATLAGQIFSRPGYIMTGWAWSDGGQKAFGLNQLVPISMNAVLYPTWDRIATALHLTVNYSGFGAVRLSGGNVPSGWTGKLEPGQSFTFILQPYEGQYVYSILLAGWYRNVQYGNQFTVTYDMLQGQNQTMTIRFESIYMRPKTGDDANVGLWAVLCLFAGIAACATGVRIQETGVRIQETGVRIQDTGDRRFGNRQ